MSQVGNITCAAYQHSDQMILGTSALPCVCDCKCNHPVGCTNMLGYKVVHKMCVLQLDATMKSLLQPSRDSRGREMICCEELLRGKQY